MSNSYAQRDSLLLRIYNIKDLDYTRVALDVFHYQVEQNPLYRQYVEALSVSPRSVSRIDEIPFLPITMFRDHVIKSGNWEAATVFSSSGTTGAKPGKHYVRELTWYHKIAALNFSRIFGSPSDFTWIGLLPSYLDRPDSSLVNMVQAFMQGSGKKGNGFYPDIHQELIEKLERLSVAKTKVALMGVSFALLDLFEQHQIPVWDQLLVIETGGMKGRREEITRQELHDRMRYHHPDLRIVSEYGMTELISQAYDRGDGFQGGPAMRVVIRDISDPLALIEPGQRGAINIIDLANIDSCAFIATDDIGIQYDDGSFDVLGRLDQSDIRGCNLLYES